MASLSDLGRLAETGEILLSPDATGTRPQIMEVQPKLVERFAGKELTPKVLAELLTPWEKYDKDSSRPNYEGRNEEQWKADNRRIKGQLEEYTRRGKLDQYGEAILIENGFTNAGERRKILEDVVNEFDRRNRMRNRGQRPSERTDVLRNEFYGVPNARADEDLSMAVLEYSGYSPVRALNENNVQGTDIGMTLGSGQRVNVDAQTRTNPVLELGIVGKSNRNLLRQILEQPELPLNQFILQQLDSGTRFTEDKLLQTRDRSINPIQSGFMTQDTGSIKDFIISSYRPTATGGKAPYDPTKATDWDLIDLDILREKILPKSLIDLQRLMPNNDKVLSGYRDKGLFNLKVRIDNEMIKRLASESSQLDPEVVKTFSQPPARRMVRGRNR